ncbi:MULTISPECIES: phosphoenolpyruvate carboxykinase (ATP) [unclassified Lysinibacillus]|uniref:phosphoenolpyruvate carboxykinase (ATP) n=1 Tax=unclassified Lysinibacillus TaxID=2636778 RepID=UPI00201189D2|nr:MULTISPECIES: phosphoenolpyruvate carboxykinase (ATP) [unclassified Lysinibacillus]MCL1695339.1 phosphoenolpyruvate carboxykinase (ATP) [Lysinibacillus sp. BPa_S21]MCL1700981.1 phosphoenolpyruvate carboxykinase (ATP) [Lysinibacillus sp. Bpr_S20]
MNSVEIANELKELLSGGNINVQLSVPQLAEKATSRGEAMLTVDGAVRAETGKYTGRSPKDKYTVEEESTKDKIDWGKVNRPISSEVFDNLYVKVVKYLKERDELFVFKGFAGADKDSQLSIQVINEYAWHNLFAHQLFIRPTKEELASHVADFTVISAPNFKADPVVDGTASETFIIVSLEKKIILIGGTEYAGEIKKSIFGIMNYLLPQQGILSMHCSANVGEAGDVALFFGLSGTGKTTLSADPDRKLIGDDEHGWSDNGVFNIEGGCYAKTINLSAEKEPEIYNAIRFGSVLENVAVDPETRICDYDDGSLTENTRVAYPIQYIENIVDPSVAGHPKTIIFLTADAFGVLPPISKLTKEQAMYHFLSGFTSKLAGTERGVTEPEPVFSTCFGSPFLPLPATVYAEMLGQKIDEHGAQVFLVNTGWTGGEYGTGSRMKLSYTRAMVRAAIDGKLANVETTQDSVFGLNIPTSIEGVPSEVLNPRDAWADKAAYDKKAAELAGLFNENFKKFSNVSEAITKLGGPLK